MIPLSRTRLAQLLFLVAAVLVAFLITLTPNPTAPSVEAACSWNHVTTVSTPFMDWGYGMCGDPDCYYFSGNEDGTCWVQDSNYSCSLYAVTCTPDECPVGQIGVYPDCRAPTCAEDPGMEGCSCTKVGAGGCHSTGGVISGGSCNAAEPAACACSDYGQSGTYPQCFTPGPCSGPANSCGVSDSGTTVDFWGNCSATTPPAVSDACPADPGVQCTIADCSGCVANAGEDCNVNACGVAGGTVTCGGSCSGGMQAADQCPADPGVQCDAGECSCVPNTSCAATTCSTATCSDGCGGTVNGTMTGGACGGGGGADPSVSCSPATSTVAPGTSVTFTATPADGAGPTYTWINGSNGVLGTGATYAQVFNTAGNVRVRANDGAGGTTPASGYCTVDMSGGGCTGAGPVSITATPSRIQPGDDAVLTWSGSNINAATCTVTNLNTNTQIDSESVSSCGVTTQTYNLDNVPGQTTFRLECGSLVKDVVVNLIPRFEEF